MGVRSWESVGSVGGEKLKNAVPKPKTHLRTPNSHLPSPISLQFQRLGINLRFPGEGDFTSTGNFSDPEFL